MEEAIRTRLFELLDGDPVPEVRAEAARALGTVPESDLEVVRRLVDALADGNDKVRRAATLALGRLRHPAAVDALLVSLESNPELWQETSAALTTAAEPEVIERLVPLLSAPVSHTRCGALRTVAALTARAGDGEAEPLFVYTDEEGHRYPLF